MDLFGFVFFLIVMTAYSAAAIDPPREIFLKHVISPLAICDEDKPVDPHKKIDECHSVCGFDPVSQGRSELTIYKDNSASKKYSAVMCEKWKISQTFTQTWTFSTIRSELTKERVGITESECFDAVSDRCSDFNCNYQIPDHLDEEYYYASTHTKTKEFLVLITVPAVMVFYDGRYQLHIAHEKTSVTASDGRWNLGLRIYVWDKKEGEGCPFDAGMSLGCDKWKTGESINFVCGNGRLAFEASGSKDVGEKCTIGMKMSPEGIIYREDRKKPTTDYNAQRIALASDTKLAADTETLRVLTSNSLIHLDADLCAVGCEVSGLELRVGRRQTTLIRTGAGYVLLSPKGHGYDCAKALQCSIVKPYRFCGNPPRIHIMCNGVFYFWNPAYSFVLNDNGCHAPSSAEKLYIHLGNHKYSLDDDLTIEVPGNESSTIRTSSFVVGHGSLINYEDIPDLRAGWTQAKSSQRMVIEKTGTQSVDQHSIFDLSIFSPLKSLASWMSNVINNVERAVLAVLALLFCMYISKPIIMYLLGSRKWKHTRMRQGGERGINSGVYEVEMI